MADKVYIIGHKNPDNDAISAAVALAYFESQLAAREGREVDYVPVRLGPLPAETAWNLEAAGIPAPELIERVGAGDQVILVDHNELGQAVDGLGEAEVVGIVDHHRIGDVTTAQPIFMTVRPWGSTATLITWLCRENDVEIPAGLARVLLGAILTDTVIQKSPTATPMDDEQIAFLEGITGLERVAFGRDLFNCRGAEADLAIEQYVCGDSKEFETGVGTVLIGQHETVDIDAAMQREDEARAYLRQVVADKGYTFGLLFVTDILAEGSYFMVEGDGALVGKVFGIDPSATTWMPGVLSRKKQVAAPILAG